MSELPHKAPRKSSPEAPADPGPLRRYSHGNIERKWQARWEESSAFAATESSGKYYVLEMFPYPSGKIHMGHVRNYSIGDVVARFYKMKGQNVLHPMGWDSFGLPAENAAREHSIHPARWTYENIEFMKRQLKSLGFSYDWTRELATCTPEYYRWNQWLFLKFLAKGLAYKKSSSVNWCPECVTVLANEQVEDGTCWRCASAVEAKRLDQWFFKITEYAEELLESTYSMDGWPERVLVMQRNWIGKSVGATVSFKVEGTGAAIDIFTTRPDTLYGVTFMSLAPTHPLVEEITTEERRARVRAFVDSLGASTTAATAEAVDTLEFEKEGVFTGAYAINPLSDERIPVYVANFVLMEYGTGAVMAVPAHDQRDFEFAGKYDLPIKVVIKAPDASIDPDMPDDIEEAYVDPGVMVNSGPFDGTPSDEGKGAVTKLLIELGIGKESITYRLRDWGISRQRYWGCPIPVVYCSKCGIVPVPFEELPVTLDESVKLTEAPPPGEEVACPGCSGTARRETDTMDTFVDSSWYFLRYTSPAENLLPFTKGEADRWMPVDRYIGGIEHAVMHLLYARFFTKAMRDLGLVDCDEPFKNLLTQGMVCKETMRCAEHGFLLPEEVRKGKCKKCSTAVVVGAVEKMSKSKKNIVDPDRIIAKYGADTTRLFSLFAAPPERDLDWSVEGVEGSYRFLSRVWRLVVDNMGALDGVPPYDPKVDPPLGADLKELRRVVHKTIEKVTVDIEERFHFNTAISSIMELVNALYIFTRSRVSADPPGPKVFSEAVNAVVLLLAPFAPHISEELWEMLGNAVPVYKTPWPPFDAEALVAETVTLVVQINGKVRSRISLPPDASKESAVEIAKLDSKVVEWTKGKEILKLVYVPNKILNMVVL